MRKIVAGLSISLDGVIEDPNEWMGPYFNAEVGQAVDGLGVGNVISAPGRFLTGSIRQAPSLRSRPDSTRNRQGHALT